MLTDENEVEENYKYIQDPNRWIVLDMPFPIVDGTPRSSSWLRSFEVLNLEAQNNG
jgi:hypothetical protein